ncbi:MAG: hypothetical protein IJ766_00570 [Clostridia bacterium]|nr:hypothetical protein [Clostridia bacterium]
MVNISPTVFVYVILPFLIRPSGKERTMIINYTFADGISSEIEVTEEVGTCIIDTDKQERNGDRKERRHCWSLDAIVYEGSEYGRCDEYDDGSPSELQLCIRAAFAEMTEPQKRRLLQSAQGLTCREIGEQEGVSFRAVAYSIEGAKKILMRHCKKFLH